MKLAKNSVIKSSNVKNAGVAKDYLRYACQDELIEKVAHGVYILKDELKDDWYVFQLQNSKTIFAASMAAYLHDLTTRDPLKIYATVPLEYNTSKIKKGNLIVREKPKLMGWE